MSRLQRMIDRLLTQRACLHFAAQEIADLAGPVFEIGLGKGRTYSYLRELLPDREIYAFDREVHAPADAQPDADHIVLGDFRDALADAGARFGGRVALIHADIGSEKPERDAQLAADLGPSLAALAASGGLILCDRELSLAAWPRLPLPSDAGDWDYFIYRAP